MHIFIYYMVDRKIVKDFLKFCVLLSIIRMVYYVKIQKYVIWRNHMILACQNISKAFGTTEIIKNASFHIEEREKAALVGINGAGKSTLLKIIIGEMRADEGEVILSKGKTMAISPSIRI